MDVLRGTICGIDFGLLTSENVDDYSVVDLTDAPIKKKTFDGVCNKKLGAGDANSFCSICAKNIDGCQGHMGKLQLYQPVINILFMPILPRIFSIFCIRCSRILVPDSHLNRFKSIYSSNYKKKITELYALTIRNRICWFDEKNPKSKPRLLSTRKAMKKGYCGTLQPDVWSIIRDEKMIIRPSYYLESIDDFKNLPIITPKLMYEMLRGVSVRDHLLLGFDPKKSPLHAMFFSSFPISPMIIRQSRNGIVEDDLTKRSREIQKANQLFKKHIIPNLTMGLLREPNYNRQKLLTNIEIKDLIKIQGPLSKKHTHKKIGVIPECLESYFELQRHVAGYIDCKFHGKLDKDFGREIQGVKQRYVANANHPGRVRYQLNAKRTDLSARGVITPDTDQEIDEIGLPKTMMMTLAYPELCSPYNFHILQERLMNGASKYPGVNYIERKKDEFFFPDACEGGLQFGDSVHRHLVNGDPVLVNRQPTLHKFSLMAHKARLHNGSTIKPHLCVMGCYAGDFDGDEMNILLPHNCGSRAEAIELLAVSKNLLKDGKLMVSFVQHAVIGAYVLTNGNQIFEKNDIFQLLMQGVHYDLIDEAMDALTTKKINFNGQDIMKAILPTYELGIVLTKQLLNSYMLKIVQNYPKDNDKHIKRMGFITRILETYCQEYGVSIGLEDYGNGIHQQEQADELKIKANELSVIASLKKKRDPDDEYAIITYLSRSRDLLGIHKLEELKSKSTIKTNGFLNTVCSGAKGNETHITQSAVEVGLQLNGVNQRNQLTLNYYFKDDISKHGYITRSFKNGLTALEFYQHLFSSRIGLIGASVKPAVTGYLYRKITKFVEDLQIYWDGSVRNANGQIIMFHYGFDTLMLCNFHFEITKLNITEIIDIYHVQDPNDNEDLSSIDEISKLLILRYRILFYAPNTIPLPIDMKVLVRLLNNREKNDDNGNPPPLKLVRNAIAELWTRLVIDHHIPNTELYEAAFFDCLSTKNLLKLNALVSMETFEFTLDFIASRYTSQLCPMGAPKGADSAQGLSEPGTQGNLKSFHISGEENCLVDGVVRLGEIINLVKNIATPSQDIYIEKGYESVFDPLQSLVELYIDSIVVNIFDKPHNNDMLIGINDIVLTMYLNNEHMTQRKLPPRIVGQRLLALSKLLGRERNDVRIQYCELRDPIWWITIVINRYSKIIKGFSKATEPLPLLSLQLYHQLRHEKTILAGVAGIKDFCKFHKKIWVPDAHDDNKLKEEERLVYQTKGSNLAKVCLLPFVDIENTTTNDIHQIYNVFGIDAAMHAIEYQLYQTMVELDSSISSRHVTLIANTMCASGILTPLTFAGMNSSKHCNSYLKLSTFERPLESFLGAGISGHDDNLKGVSESIIVGTKVNIGTGSNFSVISDLTLIPKCHQYNIQMILNRAKKMKFNPPDISLFMEIPKYDEVLLEFKLNKSNDLLTAITTQRKRKTITTTAEQWGGFDLNIPPSSPKIAKKTKKSKWNIALDLLPSSP